MELRTSVVVLGVLAAIAAIGCGDDTSSTSAGGGGSGGDGSSTTTASSSTTGSTTASTTTAVSSSGSGGAGGGTGGAGGAAPVYALTEGTYEGVLDEVNPTCGTFGDVISLTPWIVSWSDETHFTLEDPSNAVSTACVRTGVDATCEAYVYSFMIDADSTVEVTTDGPAVTILTTDSFEDVELSSLDCVGPGCDAFAAQFETSFPCELGYRGTFTLAP